MATAAELEQLSDAVGQSTLDAAEELPELSPIEKEHARNSGLSEHAFARTKLRIQAQRAARQYPAP
jgi:hypothetical protein